VAVSRAPLLNEFPMLSFPLAPRDQNLSWKLKYMEEEEMGMESAVEIHVGSCVAPGMAAVRRAPSISTRL